jgi:hypothetical protein
VLFVCILLPVPQGENPFAVKINNNKIIKIHLLEQYRVVENKR